MEQTVCELFAGVGGFRLGLEKASSDWKTVWFSQWEPGKTKQWAHECYVAHWGDVDENTGVDIALVDKKDIPKHNLLVGGFPCQGFTIANLNRSMSDDRNFLYMQLLKGISVKQPPFFLLENVKGLENIDGGQVLPMIIKDLEKNIFMVYNIVA